MRKIFTAICIAASLSMVDVRMVVCQVAGTAQRDPSKIASAGQQAQSEQKGSAATTRAAQLPPVQLDEKSRKIKRTVQKIGVAGRLTLYLKNGEELYGSIVRYDEESLQVAEVDLKQVVTVQYGNVRKVREDYGKPNIFTGKRTNPPKGVRIGVVAAALVFAFLPIIALVTIKD